MARSASKTVPAGKDDAFLTLARKRFKVSSEAEADRRKAQLSDKKFAAGDHWPESITRERAADGRPCLVIDRLKPQIKQVTNQQRAMRPSVQISTADGAATPKIAEVLQGLVRNIETSSDADDAYDQAGKDQAEIGLGWFRIRTVYCDDESGNQDIVIDRIRNPFSVYDDPAAVRRDRSDRNYLFNTSDLSADEIKARYPGAKYTSADLFDGLGDEAPDWIQGDRLRIAEYWQVKTAKTAKALGNGKTRQVETKTVTCHIISALEVLETYAWAGKHVPFVCVLGEEVDIEGKLDLRGMVRGAKDPQRMFNYWKSATTEAMALAPKAPYVAAEGQIDGQYKSMWLSANSKNLPFLVYKPKTIDGLLCPPPERQTAEPAIQAMMAETQAAENDIRAATGFFDTNQNETREMSGRAIQARQAQGEHGNSDYIDGVARAVRFAGRILVDLIPKIYDVPRVVRILGLDGKPQSVMVHAGQAPDPQDVPEGVKDIYDLSVGKYDVIVSAGASEPSRRQAFIDQMSGMFDKNPDLFKIMGDLYFENMDLPNALQIAARLKKMLPPQLQTPEDGQAPTPEQMQAQIHGMGQQLDQAHQALAEAQKPIAVEQARQQGAQQLKQMDLEFQKWKAERDSETKLAVAELGAKVDRLGLFMEERARLGMEGQQSADRQAAADAAKHASAHDVAMAAMSHAHGKDAAAQGADLAQQNAEHAQAIAPPDAAARAA